MAYKDHPDNILGANNTNNSYLSTSVAANADGSIIERQEYIQSLLGSNGINKNSPNYFSVTADMSSATWKSVATHEIATVTGTVRIRILPVCTASLGNDSNTCKISLGTSASGAAFIGATTATQIDTAECWLYATGASNVNHPTFSAIIDRIVTTNDIGYTIATTACTAGSVTFHCSWEPISSTGAVTAGAGGTLT